MKTVVVFDTEDERGMVATCKIVDHLAQEYLGRHLAGSRTVTFKKIAFIKMMRAFAKEVEEGRCSSGLKDTKHYADAIFDRNRFVAEGV